jgi:squalene-hopene/tetraprenyl-beta-curcumene cyclase
MYQRLLTLIVGVIFLSHQSLRAADINEAIAKGTAYLAQAQAENGSYSPKAGTGVTSLVTLALIRNGKSVTDPTVAKGLKFLEANVRADGGIYAEKSFLQNYETSLAVVCLQAANADGRYKETIAKADKFLKSLQFDETDKMEKSDLDYGGVNYGTKGRPDLSNTAYLVEALVAAGNGPDDPALKNALVFISRCQNLESEHNTTAASAKVNDGGFYYSVAQAEAADPKSQTAQGGLRSYGSMSYAGLKSMLYAGLKPDDKRVAAAMKWLSKNYDLEKNPGLGEAGLYYYYHLMAKALDTVGSETFTDDAGVKHQWRSEMAAAIIKRQKENGSWTNSDTKWMEGDPNLATGFALLSLSYCQPKSGK